MGVDLSSTGNGNLGPIGTVSGYTLSVDATPLSATDTGGGTPTVSINIEPGTELNMSRLMTDDIVLTDTESRGSLYARVVEVEDSQDGATITAETVLSRLVGKVTIAPFSGTLGDYLVSIIGRAGGSIGVDIEDALAAVTIVMPEITGDAWSIINALAVAFQYDVGMLDQVVTFRAARSASFSYRKISSKNHKVSEGPRARQVQVTYQNSTWHDNELVYPTIDQRSEEMTNIISGPPGNVVTVSLSTPGIYLTYVVQPVPIFPNSTPQRVPVKAHPQGPGAVYGQSSYTILDGDGQYVNPEKWSNAGGSVTIEIDGGERLTLTMRIPAELNNGPYSIARSRSQGDSENTENSLEIYGTGTFTSSRDVLLPTGTDDTITVEDVASTTVDSLVYQGAAEAYTAALGVAMQNSGVTQTLDINIPLPKLEALNSEWAAYTFANFNAAHPTSTFTNINTEWSGLTFAQLDAVLVAQALATFGNRLFGLLAGGRLGYGWSNYRIQQVTVTESGFELSCVQDTICTDVESLWTGLTCADVEAAYGYESTTCLEFAMMPLYLPGISAGGGSLYGTGVYGTGVYGL